MTTTPIVSSDPTSWISAAATGDVISCPVTPDALLAMLQLRLRDADGQIADAMSALNNNTANASRLSALLQQLNALKEIGSHNATHMHDSSGVVDGDLQPGEYMDGSGFLDDGHTHADGPTSGQAVADANAALTAAGLPPIPQSTNGSGENFWKATDIQAAIDSVTQHLRDANTGNDQLMVQVQSLTQSRTTSIQMVSNMLKATNDGLSAIVQNMR